MPYTEATSELDILHQILDPKPPLPGCQCTWSCPMSVPCENVVTQEDFLCDPCREAKKQGLTPAEHCHECGDEPDDDLEDEE